MTDFDMIPGVIHRGLGFVARWPGLVLVIPSDPNHDQAAEDLLGALGPEPAPAQVARAVQDAVASGRLLAAGYLAMAPGGPVALVSGPMEVVVDGQTLLSGAGGPVEQQVPATDRLTLRAANLAKAAEPVFPYDLRRGVAPGAGITLGQASDHTSARPYAPPRPDQIGRPQAPEGYRQPPPDPAPGLEPAEEIEPSIPFRSRLLFDQVDVVEPRPALAIATRTGPDPASTRPYEPGYSATADRPANEPDLAPGQAMVHGILCSRGHFNNPSASYCLMCGIAMIHVTHNLVPGVRPTLGFVVFDDGSTFGLDRSYLVGREPGETNDPSVASLTIQDNNETLSRRHAEIRLIDWGVHLVDLESTNGSFVWDDHTERWNPLTPYQPVPLNPGDTVALGRRTFVFESTTGL